MMMYQYIFNIETSSRATQGFKLIFFNVAFLKLAATFALMFLSFAGHIHAVTRRLYGRFH